MSIVIVFHSFIGLRTSALVADGFMCRGESPDDATGGLGAVPTPIDPKVTGLSAYLFSFSLREFLGKMFRLF